MAEYAARNREARYTARGAKTREDAPPGHDAHDKVRAFPTHRNPLADVYYTPSNGGPTIRVQATEKKTNDSLKEACRVCRLLYMKLAEGWTLQQVLEYRDNVLYPQYAQL